MEKKGIASIWIGNGDSRQNLIRMTEYSISDGGLGEFVAAPFCQALGIEHYDPDLFGGKFFPKQLTRLSLLFHGDPMLPEILERWPEIPPSNCKVDLYDYKYNGKVREFEIESFRFLFLGTFQYA